jgi:GntR family transcriptional repressor for pyruvate dehydrogenase complex
MSGIQPPAEGSRKLRLGPLSALSLKEQVVRELTRLIEEGALSQGQRLPSERELSEQLGVSRGTVREAVQLLGALGMVEVRHGSGTYVRESGLSGLREEWRRWTRRHSDRVRSLLEVRRGLECLAAELAASRVDDDGLNALGNSLALMEEAIARGDVPSLVDIDLGFHHALCAASQNPALTELAASLGEQLIQERGATWDIPYRPRLSLDEHRAIYEAVRSRDPQRAREALRAHLESVERDVRELSAEPPEGEHPEGRPVPRGGPGSRSSTSVKQLPEE